MSVNSRKSVNLLMTDVCHQHIHRKFATDRCPKQNVLSGVKLLSRDNVSHIPNEIHMRIIPHAITRNCKQLIIQKYHMEVYHKWGSHEMAGLRYLMSVITLLRKLFSKKKNNSFPSKCHNSDIGIDKLLFQNPRQDKPPPATPLQAPLCIRYSRCYKWFDL